MSHVRLAVVFWGALALTMAGLVGCGDEPGSGEASSGASGSSSEGQQLCTEDCANLASAGCSLAPDQASCEANCMMSYGKCPVEVKASVDCGATYMCDGDGKPFPSGCDAELTAFQACYND